MRGNSAIINLGQLAFRKYRSPFFEARSKDQLSSMKDYFDDLGRHNSCLLVDQYFHYLLSNYLQISNTGNTHLSFRFAMLYNGPFKASPSLI